MHEYKVILNSVNVVIHMISNFLSNEILFWIFILIFIQSIKKCGISIHLCEKVSYEITILIDEYSFRFCISIQMNTKNKK